jgi:head-tail adaptor
MKAKGIGAMREPVTFIKMEVVPDGAGGRIEQNTTPIKEFCKVVNVSNQRNYDTNTLNQLETYELTFRRNPNINAQMTAQWNGLNMQIVSISQHQVQELYYVATAIVEDGKNDFQNNQQYS